MQSYKKERAIKTFVSLFGGSYELLGSTDVFCKIYDKDRKLIAYVEMVESVTTLAMATQLMIPVKRLVKVYDKRLNPTIIWSCEDGIIYAKVDEIEGYVKSGVQPTPSELTCIYDKNRKFKYVRYK